MVAAKVLLVDDDEIVRFTLAEVLRAHGFDVTVAASVPEALKRVTSETYNVLLSDLHMPGAGDGLTVVSAMRHTNPGAITLLLSAFPEMTAATHAILVQADRILAKPIDVAALVDVIEQSLTTGPHPPRVVESVATILERSAQSILQDWFERVQREKSLIVVPLSYELRCGYLPQFFRDLVDRLRASEPLGMERPKSVAAAQHGAARRKQGYTAAMIVEEARILQGSIFRTLQINLASIDFSMLLMGVMTIADEIDSQLGQAMQSYIARPAGPRLVA